MQTGFGRLGRRRNAGAEGDRSAGIDRAGRERGRADLGHVPEVFQFMMKAGPIDIREAYATYNMGAGFAAYVNTADADACLAAAARCGLTAWRGGTVRQHDGRKAVEILPLGITFEG